MMMKFNKLILLDVYTIAAPSSEMPEPVLFVFVFVCVVLSCGGSIPLLWWLCLVVGEYVWGNHVLSLLLFGVRFLPALEVWSGFST